MANQKRTNRSNPTHRIAPRLLAWFAEHARDLPWRRTRDPYAIWVSEIMLQQTQVKTVVPYWERWMRELPDVHALAGASDAKIHKLWEGLGYYTRVRNLRKAARFLLRDHGGQFPKNFDAVLALPGIGRYTAGAICSIAFNLPTPVLDGNVMRVLTRAFGIVGDPREKKTNARLWLFASELVQRVSRLQRHTSSCSHLNQALMELGATICTPRQPKCPVCPLKTTCVAFRRHRVEQLPASSRSTTSTARHFMAFIVERHGKLLVRQRPAGVVNAHLWEFPNLEVAPETSPAIAARKLLGQAPSQFVPCSTVKHSITRYRITLEAYRARFSGAPTCGGGVWLSPLRLRQLAFTAAHGKVLKQAFSEH